MEEILKSLEELEESLFTESEEENDPEIRKLHYEVEDILSEWDKIRVEEVVRICKEYGHEVEELDEDFWWNQDSVLISLILDIYNSKEKEPK